MNIIMNSKKNKKTNADSVSIRDNKKSKTTIEVENSVEVENTPVKKQRKKVNTVSSEIKNKPGRKRKQPDTDVNSPLPKKSKKNNQAAAEQLQINTNLQDINKDIVTNNLVDVPSNESQTIENEIDSEIKVSTDFLVKIGETKIVQNGLADREENKSDISKKTRIRVKQVISWPAADLMKLVDRMEASIPEGDTLTYQSRTEKLQWDLIPFNNYTIEECKETWSLLQKRIRRYRLLKEVLEDAKEWIAKPKINKSAKNNKPIRHPDMPRRPLTAYFIYYINKKDEYNREHPGLSQTELSKKLSEEFRNLPPESRANYEKVAAKNKEEYERKLEEFYQAHPEIQRLPKRKREKQGRPKLSLKPAKPIKPPKVIKEKPKPQIKKRKPKRPPPPFHYYYQSELEKNEGVEDKAAFKELCKERWKDLPDQKKLECIKRAELEYGKYEENLKQYIQEHPESPSISHKPILTKEELQIKDRVAGKPNKPPGSAYSLFSRNLLQSEEIKSIPVKDRLVYVSNRWKSCEENEKNQYKDMMVKMNEQYKADYALYLETLPETERKLEIERNLPKRRKSIVEEPKKKKVVKKKKQSGSKRKPQRKEPVRKEPVAEVPQKLVEPAQPPISAFKYFQSLYTGEQSVGQAWKALTPEQKKIYEDELYKKKQEYIADFERFLKSLTKEELEEFSNSRKKIIKQEPDDDEDEEEEESSISGSGTEEESNDEEESDN